MLKKLVLLLAISPLFGSTPLIVGICGGTGSGKTTLAERIQEAFPDHSILISQDSYYKDLSYLPMEEREKNNFDHPDSLDFFLLRAHLEQLKNGENAPIPTYNFSTHTQEASVNWVKPADVIIVEGILIFAIEELRDLFDVKIFMDTDDDIRLLRRIERDIHERGRHFENIRDQYIASVKPMHEAFVEPSKRYADLIVPHGGKNPMALSLILSKLKAELPAATLAAH